MKMKILFDHSKGIRGRMILMWVDDAGQEIDREILLKHPLLLRLRLYKAMLRMKRRQEKMKIFLKNQSA